MTAKVRIDLATGILEAEGSEEFIRDLYDDFREHLAAKPESAASGQEKSQAPRSQIGAAKPTRAASERKAAGSGRRDRTPVLVKDLDLAPDGKRPGLRDFVKRYKKLSSSMDQNTLFIYFLAREAEVSPITMDHVYTCYKNVGERVPKVLPQSLWDTARKKGTIDTASLDNIKLTTAGENWVEHDLPKAASE